MSFLKGLSLFYLQMGVFGHFDLWGEEEVGAKRFLA
jgi:hypothetical protein